MEKYDSSGVHFVFQCTVSEKYVAKFAVIVVTTRAYCGADRPVYLTPITVAKRLIAEADKG